MKISEFVQRYPGIKLATQSENAKILKFFNESSMTGKKVVIGYDRSPDFFEFLTYSSPEYFVFYTEDAGEVTGVATLLIRPGMIDGRETMVGYLGDLRVKHSKAAFIQWKTCYQELIENFHQIDEFKQAKFLITAVMDHNMKARRALIENKENFIYHHLCGYEMVNVIMKKPFIFRSTSAPASRRSTVHPEHIGAEVVSATENSFIAFQKKKNDEKPFGFVYPFEFDYRKKHWPNFSIKNCYEVKVKGETKAAFVLWSPEQSKKVLLHKMSTDMKLLLSPLRLLNPPLKEKAPLKFLYINALEIEKGHEHLISEILHFIFKQGLKSGYHALSFCNYPLQDLKPHLADFVFFNEPMGLYQVTDNKSSTHLQGKIPGFEMSLV